jgi:ubiquitin-conjugating enzyme E2 Z
MYSHKMNTIILRDTVNRLLKDVRHIMKNPLTDNGIYYVHDDADMLKGYALIIGPSDTPYFGGFYFFEFNYPANYPHSPPVVKYLTNGFKVRFNPNLYTCGKVCISILNTWTGEQWTSCQTISTILLTLCTLLCKNPLLNEPGVTVGHRDLENYNKIIEFANIDIAICDVVCKNNIFNSNPYHLFYNHVLELFLKNYDTIMEFCVSKVKSPDGNMRLTTGFYGMDINIDYSLLIAKLENSKILASVISK